MLYQILDKLFSSLFDSILFNLYSDLKFKITKLYFNTHTVQCNEFGSENL